MTERSALGPIPGIEGTDSSLGVLVIMAGAAIIGYLAALLLYRILRRIGRHSQIVSDLAVRGRRPTRFALVVLGLLTAANAAVEQSWTPPTVRVLGLALIAAIAWLVGVLAFVVEDLALSRYRMDIADNRHARRIRTQVTLLRRITVLVISLIAIASMLMTIPSVRVAGASIVASAGVVGIIAGLAAQTSLANMFAGLQLAFTDAIRVDDVVVVEDEWGRIEEITLTYVVVHIWDDRRMILPSTYFTTNPFQNWTRRESAVLGAVEFDLDWSVPVNDMRAEMHRIVENTELWDGRVSVLQVTDAISDHVRIRVLVSGKDGPTTFDLRCHVREALVDWLRRRHSLALPRTRIEIDRSPAELGAQNGHGGRFAPTDRVRLEKESPEMISDARLFTGSADAEERSRAFSETGEPTAQDDDRSDGDPRGPRQRGTDGRGDSDSAPVSASAHAR
ncbi:mechanosensitive ion channel protein MscS [Parafrankia colletiae]|uniref:Mechanosensitive ion channel protein MscS n=1 Tax=Parafrankia colletiae TaxID=573497 RepID=A0A1S1QZY8_9ACTN|nr:mechanosensitive ion channel family protein [Parafrankia colletiae]MCK9899058.1 mechanosensitive ion channel family protein [Frankia sp. Cpl3]OHV38632.1 mechanosensitive ion channel protein MscS [Parafrankia colletiae]